MTGSTITARANVDPAAWDELAASSASAWIWHVAPMIDALETWPRHADRSFAVLDPSGAPVAIVPLFKVSDRMAGVIEASRLTSVGGPAIRDGIGARQRREVAETIAGTLDDMLQQDNASWVEATVAAMTPAVRASAMAPNPLLELGSADCSKSTWVVDLKADETTIRSAYSSLTRRQLRKAQDDEFAIREAQGLADCEHYYALHTETCARTGAAPLPPDYMQCIFRDLVPRGLSRVLFLERKGAIVAAQNTGLWKGGAIYWSGASRDDRSGGDNRLLFDAQIMFARKAGCDYYETGQAYPMTSDAKERGLSDFKASFGAVLGRFPHGRRYVKGRSRRWLAGLRVARAIARGEMV